MYVYFRHNQSIFYFLGGVGEDVGRYPHGQVGVPQGGIKYFAVLQRAVFINYFA